MNEQLIIEHYKSPHHFGKPEVFSTEISVANMSCGDELFFYATYKNDRLASLAFTGSGCSICLASASILINFVYKKEFLGLQAITEEDLLSTLDIPKEHKRSPCVLLSFTALQKLLKEA